MMKKIIYRHMLGIGITVSWLLAGCAAASAPDLETIEYREPVTSESTDEAVCAPVLEYEETDEEFLIPLSDELADSLETASCAIAGREGNGYYPILWGREVMIDDDHVIHIPKEQAVMTLYFEDTKQWLLINRMEESIDSDGNVKWYTKNFSFNSDISGSEYYHVDVNFEETDESDFLEYKLTPTSNKMYNPANQAVAYKYWKYIHSMRNVDEDIHDSDGVPLPATEWPGKGLYMRYYFYPESPDGLKFQLKPIRELLGTYYCQLILKLQDGSAVSSELMLLQVDNDDPLKITTEYNLAKVVEVNTDNGVMYFQIYADYAALVQYSGEDLSVIVPWEVEGVPVKVIGCEAFCSNSIVREVELPSALTRIEGRAFYDMNLAKINLPGSLEDIGCEAFGRSRVNLLWGGDSDLEIETLNIGKHVVWIGDGAFSGYCIRNFTIDPENPYYMSEDGVIYSKDRLHLLACPAGKNRTFYVPEGVIDISPAAFQHNGSYSGRVPDSYGITTMILSDSVQRFECNYDCLEHLQSLTIGRDLEKWSYSYFCQKLTELTISSDNNHYLSDGKQLFNGDKTELIYYLRNDIIPAVYVPEGVKTIAEYVFDLSFGCTIEEVHIPEGVTTIMNGNFYGISQMDEWDIINIYLPDSLVSIEGNSFLNSPGIIFHASVDSYAASFAEENQIPLELTETPR